MFDVITWRKFKLLWSFVCDGHLVIWGVSEVLLGLGIFVILYRILSLLPSRICGSGIAIFVWDLVWFAFSLFIYGNIFLFFNNLYTFSIYCIRNLLIFDINHTFHDSPLFKDVKLIKADNAILNDSDFECSCSTFRKGNCYLLRWSSIIFMKV
jgi:hypothetical protein